MRSISTRVVSSLLPTLNITLHDILIPFYDLFSLRSIKITGNQGNEHFYVKLQHCNHAIVITAVQFVVHTELHTGFDLQIG